MRPMGERFGRRWAGAAAALIGAALLAQAPAPPAIAEPKVQAIVPCGITRGTSVDLVITGANLGESITLGRTFPARVTTPTDGATGKDSTNLRIKLEVPAELSIGWHPVRVLTTQGLSNFRPFCIDALPQLMTRDGARSRDTAQPVSIPCVIVGRVTAEASDFYKFSVTAGQRLSFEVLGRRLGSPSVLDSCSL